MKNATVNKLCPACEKQEMSVFYELDSVPSNSCILLDSEQDAKAYPSGQVKLAYCEHCGFISNTAFDPVLTEYSGRYEETQGFSPTFRNFHEGLAKSLIEQYELKNKTVVEIGCGKGEFLHLICDLGNNKGLGFDPSYVEDREQRVRGKNVEFVKDYFSDKHHVDEADFVCCKMTLEHIPKVHSFVNTVRNSVNAGPDSIIYFQVPESTRIIKECAFEDIYYEHCSYFSPTSLASLFGGLGFDVLRTGIEYGEQYLTVEAKWSGNSGQKNSDGDDRARQALTELVRSFPARVKAKTEQWRNDIVSRASQGQTIALWGSGSKAVSFLTTLDVGSSVKCVVDINPYRQGFHIPGAGHKIVSPEDLQALKPDYVVVMNRIYVDEIRASLREIGLTPELAAL